MRGLPVNRVGNSEFSGRSSFVTSLWGLAQFISVSFLNPFLLQLHIETQAADLVGQNIEASGRAGLQSIFSFDHGLIDFGPALDVVGFHRQELLEDIDRKSVV